MPCKRCGSYAINHNHHGRDGSDPDLCDVCYWRKRAEEENEACAEECERMMMYPGGRQEAPVYDSVWDAAKAIRARVKP